MGRELELPTKPNSSCLRPLASLTGAADNDRTFQLREGREDSHQHLGVRPARRVDSGLAQRSKARPGLLDISDRIKEVPSRSREPVDLANQHYIAGPKCLEQACKLGPIGLGSAFLL